MLQYLKNKFSDEELLFPAVETLSIVLPTYAKCKGFQKREYRILAVSIKNTIFAQPKLSSENIANAATTFLNDFMNYIQNNGGKKGKFNFGYSVFAINLILKKFSFALRNKDRIKLDAPLNKNELKNIKARFKDKNGKIVRIKAIKDIRDQLIYKSVIQQARVYAKKQKDSSGNFFTNLYDWEMWFWNNK